MFIDYYNNLKKLYKDTLLLLKNLDSIMDKISNINDYFIYKELIETSKLKIIENINKIKDILTRLELNGKDEEILNTLTNYDFSKDFKYLKSFLIVLSVFLALCLSNLVYYINKSLNLDAWIVLFGPIVLYIIFIRLYNKVIISYKNKYFSVNSLYRILFNNYILIKDAFKKNITYLEAKEIISKANGLVSGEYFLKRCCHSLKEYYYNNFQKKNSIIYVKDRDEINLDLLLENKVESHSYYLCFTRLVEKKLLQLDKVYNIYTGEFIDNLSPYEFEEFIALLFEQLGYKANITKGSGDNGVDIFLKDSRGFDYIVQCKKYRNIVPPSHIRDLIGTMKYYNAYGGFLVTTGSFSKSTIEKFSDKVKLVDKIELMKMIFSKEVNLSKIIEKI